MYFFSEPRYFYSVPYFEEIPRNGRKKNISSQQTESLNPPFLFRKLTGELFTVLTFILTSSWGQGGKDNDFKEHWILGTYFCMFLLGYDCFAYCGFVWMPCPLFPCPLTFEASSPGSFFSKNPGTFLISGSSKLHMYCSMSSRFP